MPVLVNRFLRRSLNRNGTAVSQSKPTKARKAETEDDDDDDDSSALLSQPEWRDYWEKPNYSTLGHFRHRERLLRRILRDHPLADQIRRREHTVRLLHYEANAPQRIQAKQHMVLTELLLNGQEKTSFWKDFWIFERHSAIPATYCLVLHCFAHSALDDFVRSFIGSSYFATFLGIILLRLSGDLYWWLGDDTYDALRVDFGNRRRLGDTEMEWSGSIRQKPILRAICFMIGYPICYMVSVSFNDSVEKMLFNQYDTVRSSLPSVLYFSQNYGVCPAELSFCSAVCQEFLQERERTVASQAQADLIYTWKTLPAGEYDDFWYASIDDSSIPAIVRSDTHFIYSTVSCAVAIFLYWQLLRGKFWDKY